MGSIIKQAAWMALALIGAFALGTVALSRGESINALWIVIAAVAIYMIGFNTLPEDELIKELDVIRREMDMGQDDPGRRSGNCRACPSARRHRSAGRKARVRLSAKPPPARRPGHCRAGPSPGHRW